MKITITQTATGWHIESGEPDQLFAADLNACDCDGKTAKMTQPCATHRVHNGHDCTPHMRASQCRLPLISGGYHVPHVRHFLKRLAAIYPGKVTVPDVPFDASLREGMVTR